MRRSARVATTAFALILFLAGCVGPSEPRSDRAFEDVDDSRGSIRGRVLDVEIVPIPAVDVTLLDTDFVAATDDEGLFTFQGLEPGEYTIAATKNGYASVATTVAVNAGEVSQATVTMTATSLHVPYHESRVFVALLDCSWAAATATFPCVPIDRVTGQNVTGDQSAWRFVIPAPGLANVLHEMVWTAQPTGREMKVVITEPNQPVFVGGVSRFFLFNQGPSPLRAWLTPGVTAVGGSIPFDGNESVLYSAYIRGSERNNTVPAALYIDQRANNWFTFFYNRPGPIDYTALPDA